MKNAHLTINDPFELTFMQGIVLKCYGCGHPYKEKHRKAPKDVGFRHMECRPGYNRKNNEWYPKKVKKNAYYHLKLACIQKVHPNFQEDSLLLREHIRKEMSPAHFQYIRQKGFHV